MSCTVSAEISCTHCVVTQCTCICLVVLCACAMPACNYTCVFVCVRIRACSVSVHSTCGVRDMYLHVNAQKSKMFMRVIELEFTGGGTIMITSGVVSSHWASWPRQYTNQPEHQRMPPVTQIALAAIWRARAKPCACSPAAQTTAWCFEYLCSRMNTAHKRSNTSASS